MVQWCSGVKEALEMVQTSGAGTCGTLAFDWDVARPGRDRIGLRADGVTSPDLDDLDIVLGGHGEDSLSSLPQFPFDFID